MPLAPCSKLCSDVPLLCCAVQPNPSISFLSSQLCSIIPSPPTLFSHFPYNILSLCFPTSYTTNGDLEISQSIKPPIHAHAHKPRRQPRYPHSPMCHPKPALARQYHGLLCFELRVSGYVGEGSQADECCASCVCCVRMYVCGEWGRRLWSWGIGERKGFWEIERN